MTKTEYFSYALGSGAAGWAWANIFVPEKVTRESCERVDCLHRCYGTAMTSHCGQCYDYVFKYAAHLSNASVQAQLKEVCGRCEVPAVADPEVPAEFPAYADPTFDAPMTFVEYEDAVLEAAEDADLEEQTADDSELTPEELEQREKTAQIEEFCTENVPEYADYFASRE